jgi:putative membrane protein
MAVSAELRERVRAQPLRATVVLSVLSYALVIGTFAGFLPWPSISNGLVNALGHAIAVTNAFALLSILFGVRAIKRGNVGRHRVAMMTALALIVVFLAMYLLKIGGGFEKAILVEGPIRWAYLPMLFVHIGLSVVAVPVVIHAAVLGVSHTPAELRETVHARVGRVAASAWALILALGLVTYLMLQYFDWEPREAALLLVAVPARSLWGELSFGDR